MTFQTLDLLRLANSTNTTVLNWNIEGAYTCTDTSTEPFVIKQIPLMSEEEFECKSEIIPSTVEPNPDENTDTVAIVSSVVGAMIVVLIFLAAVASCYFRRKKGQRKWFYARNQLTMPNDGLGAKTDDDDKGFEFDAFISFNEQDRSWVYTHLVPQLESSDPSDSGGIFVTISKIFHIACVLIFLISRLCSQAVSPVHPRSRFHGWSANYGEYYREHCQKSQGMPCN